MLALGAISWVVVSVLLIGEQNRENLKYDYVQRRDIKEKPARLANRSSFSNLGCALLVCRQREMRRRGEGASALRSRGNSMAGTAPDGRAVLVLPGPASVD